MKRSWIKVVSVVVSLVVMSVIITSNNVFGTTGSSMEEERYHTQKKKSLIDPNATTGKLNVRYLSEDGKTLSDKITSIEAIGTPYETVEKTIKGYEFVGMAEGSAPSSDFYINGTKTVTYLYKQQSKKVATKYGKLKVRYVTEDGVDIIVPRVTSEKIGTHYKLKTIDFKGHTFKEIDGNNASANGKYEKGTKEVCFVYEVNQSNRLNDSGLRKLVVRYVDTDGKVIRNETITDGEVGSHYEVKQVPVYGYTLVGLSDSSAPVSGQYAEETTIVTYVYDNKTV